ncbi:MAG: hypothetical protein R3F56_02170 [Planctomycetota bacterium]
MAAGDTAAGDSLAGDVAAGEGAPQREEETGAEEARGRAPCLEGWLVPPAGLGIDRLRVTYRRAAQDALLPIHLNARGAFRLFTAAPGTIDVFVHLHGDPSPLRVVPKVGLAAGTTNRDPRLQGIEFPELRLVRLDVRDTDGQPVTREVSVLVLPPRGDAGRRCRFGRGEPVAVIVRERPQRMQVCVDGFGAADVEVHESARVDLPAEASVSIQVDIDADVARDGVVMVGLEPVEGPVEGPHEERPAYAGAAVCDGHRLDVAVRPPALGLVRDGQGGRVVHCAVPGSYKVVWQLRRARTTVHGEGQVVEVGLGSTYEVALPLTARVVAAAEAASAAEGR